MGLFLQLKTDFDLGIVENFISDYTIMCKTIELLIEDLDKKTEYESSVSELFRIFHNMKSAVSFLKLEPIIKLATICKNVLEEARILQGPATNEFIDWLLIVSNQLNKYRINIENDDETFSAFESLITKLPIHLEKHVRS
ncbi:MAG: phosphorelay protein [Sulfurospirillum sp.]|nr:phosphorelay protein [Sulfurospirillum sp.]MBL0702712.1 phosphorelay protein [Sulfurospirillum sp.]